MQKILFERKNEQREFPLLDQKISQWQLWAIIIFVAFGFIGWITFAANVQPKTVWGLILATSLLPFAIILGGFYFLSNGAASTLFKLPKLRDWGFALVMVVLETIYSIVIGMVLNHLHIATNVNAVASNISNSGDKIKTLQIVLGTDLFNLMGEEILSISVFLAIAGLLFHYFGRNRKVALGIAYFLSLFIFGLLHYHTYNWNLAQLLLVLPVERFFLTGIYIRTKSIWPSFAMHYLFDGGIFLITALA